VVINSRNCESIQVTLVAVQETGTMASSDKWQEWVEAGLLTGEQVTAISAYERDRGSEHGQSVPARSAFSTTVPEAIGYLGGLLALGGLIALLSRFWEDVNVAGRLGMTGGAAIVLGVAGALIAEDRAAAFTRLRAVLWTLSIAATGITVGFGTYEWVSPVKTETIMLTVSAAVLIQAGVMWAAAGPLTRQRPLQLIVFLAAWPVVIGSAVTHLPGNFGMGTGRGLSVWATAAVILWLGLYRVVRLRIAWAVIGAVASLTGSALVSSEYQNLGLLFTLVTALALLSLAVVPGVVEGAGVQIALGVIAAVTAVQITPVTLGFYASEGGLATGLVMWAIGGLILTAGIRQMLRLPKLFEVIGALVMVAGPAVIAVQFTATAILLGVITAVGLLVVGMFPGRVLASVAGSVGLLINVPWGISHFFPGEGRAPTLIMVTGLLILGLAVLLARRLSSQRSGPDSSGPENPVSVP
jgi:hypothetical protein